MLGASIHREIVEHAREARPREAVGLLAGTSLREVEIAVRLKNIASDSRSFVADPYDQFLAFRLLESRGLELLAIYHSHPGGGTQPSQLDLEFARRWGCLHLIVAVDRPGGPEGECRAFAVGGDGSFRCIPVEIR